MISIGVSGLFAWALGPHFVAGDGIGVTYGPIRGTAWAPPSGPFALVTIAVFGLSGALLTLPSLMSMVFGQTSGVGANLTGGVVALLLAFGTAVLALRRRTQRARSRA